MTNILLIVGAFLVGACSGLNATLLGNFAVGEFVLMAMAPVLFPKFWRQLPPRQKGLLKKLFISFAIAVVCMAISDTLHGQPPVFTVRQLIKYSLLLLYVPLFGALFTCGDNFLKAYISGLLIAGVLTMFGVGVRFDLMDLSDYGAFLNTYSKLILAVVLISICFTKIYLFRWAAIPLLVLAVVFALFSSRSSAAIWMMVAVLTFVYGGRARSIPSKGKVILAIVFFAVIAITFFYAYQYLALNMYLGDRQFQKMASQQGSILGSSPLGIFLAGRPHTLPYLLSIWDHPFSGIGSYGDILAYFPDANYILGVEVTPRSMIDDFGFIGDHSVVLNFVSAYGIFTIPFWYYFVSIFVRSIKNYVTLGGDYGSFFAMAYGVGGLWVLFFSPLSGSGRLDLAFAAGGAVYASAMIERRMLRSANVR